jgi:hypothetical protein
VPSTGLTEAYIEGMAVVCGGAQEDYDGCNVKANGLRMCTHNANCVITAGETKWCSGPKTAQCYVLDKSLYYSEWKAGLRLFRYI